MSNKTRVSVRIGVKLNPVNRTFYPKLEINLPNEGMMELGIEVGVLKQAIEMVEEYERKGWIPRELHEKQLQKQFENKKGDTD